MHAARAVIPAAIDDRIQSFLVMSAETRSMPPERSRR
jgi:hypothetical protein